jgi:hypothetical protein
VRGHCEAEPVFARVCTAFARLVQGVCEAARGCARVCEGVRGCARVCERVRGCARWCNGVRVFEDVVIAGGADRYSTRFFGQMPLVRGGVSSPPSCSTSRC